MSLNFADVYVGTLSLLCRRRREEHVDLPGVKGSPRRGVSIETAGVGLSHKNAAMMHVVHAATHPDRITYMIGASRIFNLPCQHHERLQRCPCSNSPRSELELNLNSVCPPSARKYWEHRENKHIESNSHQNSDPNG